MEGKWHLEKDCADVDQGCRLDMESINSIPMTNIYKWKQSSNALAFLLNGSPATGLLEFIGKGHLKDCISC